MMSADHRTVVLYSAEPSCVFNAIRFARSEAPQSHIILIAPRAPGLPVEADLIDQHIVLPGQVLQGGPIHKVLTQDLRIGRGDLVILPLDVFQTDSHRRLQLAVLVGRRGASGLLFGGSGRTQPIRWRNLKVHEYPRQLLLGLLLLTVGTLLVAREWLRYRLRARKLRRDRA